MYGTFPKGKMARECPIRLSLAKNKKEKARSKWIYKRK